MKMIPCEVIKEIIQFVPNIDVRRDFNIYDKICTDSHDILNTVIRNQCQESNIIYDRYYCNKNKEFHSLPNEPLLNDFVDIIFRENEDSVNIEIQIWKLMKKNDGFTQHRNDNVYYVADYDDAYYWKDIKIKYEIS